MTLPKRKPTRLKEYDYSTPGMYFITICTKDKKKILGKIENEQMHLNKLGHIVNQAILEIEQHYSDIKIDKYVIMPNHIHMLITIEIEDINHSGRINPSPTTHDIPNVIGKFKAGVTRNVGDALMHPANISIWQRSYHDHIIRNEKDYQKIWEYIDTNVIRWENDCFYED